MNMATPSDLDTNEKTQRSLQGYVNVAQAISTGSVPGYSDLSFEACFFCVIHRAF
jgi:hypothetical protein